MKFHQLPPGALFEYQGVRYAKSGPLLAVEQASGRQRCLPRAARVTPLEAVPETPADAAATLDAAIAAERFYHVALGLIDGLAEGQGEGLRGQARDKLATAYETLRQALGQGDERREER